MYLLPTLQSNVSMEIVVNYCVSVLLICVFGFLLSLSNDVGSSPENSVLLKIKKDRERENTSNE